MGLAKKAKNKAKAVKGKTKKDARQGQAQREESPECREALTRLPQLALDGTGPLFDMSAIPFIHHPRSPALAAYAKVPGPGHRPVIPADCPRRIADLMPSEYLCSEDPGLCDEDWHR